MTKINFFNKFLFTLLALIGLSINAWGISITNITVNASGNGLVAVSMSTTTPADSEFNTTVTKSNRHGGFALWEPDTYYIWVKPNEGHTCTGVSECEWNNAGYYTITFTGSTGGESKTVTATFASVYTVAFNASDATSGTMTSQNFVYGVEQNLKSNAFVRSFTVTYDSDGGTCEETSAAANYEFTGWATSEGGASVYTDAQKVNNLTSEPGATINLYATWNSASVTLPEATKEGSLFNGWYNGETWVGKAGDVIVPTADMLLTAHWVDKLIPQFVLDKTEIELDQKAVLTLTHVENPTVQITPAGIVEYNAENGELTGVGLGEATITISQAATSTIAEKSEALKLNVTKKTPSLIVVLADVEQTTITLNPTQTAKLAINKVSDAEVEVSPVSNANLVAVKDGMITALDVEGTAVFRASLAETSTYKSANVDYNIVVAYAAEGTGYVLENQSETLNVYHGNTTKEYTWDDENVAGIVKFEINYAAGSIDPGYKVQQLVNGKWEDVTAKKTDHASYYTWKQETLNRAAKGVRFWGSGSLYNHVQNVSVTRVLYVEAETTEIQTAPTVDGEGILKVKYSVANGGDLKITCDNEKFTLGSYTVANVVGKSGVSNIAVHFTAQDTECDEEANVVIYNGVYRKEYKLKAKVRKITPEIAWDNVDMTYGGAAVDVAATAEQTDVTIKYEVVEGTDKIHYAEGKLYADNAGSAKVKAYIEASAKYNYAEKIIDVTVAKAASEITTTPEAIENLTYNGEAQTLIVAGEATGGELQYSLDGENYSTTLPTGTGASTYTVYYRVAENANYEGIDAASFSVTIAKAASVLTAAPEAIENLTYNGEAQTLIYAGEATGGELQYSLDGENYSTELPTGTDAGKYTVYYRVAENDNYEGVEAASLSVTIAKGTTTGVDNTAADEEGARKIMRNGQIYIMYNGTMYNVQGHVIR